jgi:hypothetical protein
MLHPIVDEKRQKNWPILVGAIHWPCPIVSVSMTLGACFLVVHLYHGGGGLQHNISYHWIPNAMSPWLWSCCYPPSKVSGPLCTQDWKPMTIPLQVLSLVKKAEPVQVRFTLRLRDQRSMCMQDGCKVYMDSYAASNGSCFMATRTTFKNHLLEVGLTDTSRKHGKKEL